MLFMILSQMAATMMLPESPDVLRECREHETLQGPQHLHKGSGLFWI